MLTHDLHEALNRYLSSKATTKAFFELLELLGAAHDSFLKELNGIAEGGQGLNNSAVALHSNIANLSAHLSRISIREVILALGRFENALGDLGALDIPTANAADAVRKAVEGVSIALDNFIAQRTGPLGWALLRAAKDAKLRIDTLDEAIGMFVALLNAPQPSIPNSASMSLLMAGSNDLAGMIKRLSALQSLYSELCMLLSVSETDYPLTIGKIETGSLWTVVFGESRVIGLMCDFAEAAARYLYRTYTREGKISAIPAKIDSLDRIIELREKLQDLNIDTDQLDVALAKGGYAIAHDLTALLERQPSITINGSKVSIGDEELAKRLSEEEWPKLSGPQSPAASNSEDGARG